MFIDKFLPKSPSVKRHLAKTITWRIVGTIDTMILGWLVSNQFRIAASQQRYE
jgi:hypothetical protein